MITRQANYKKGCEFDLANGDSYEHCLVWDIEDGNFFLTETLDTGMEMGLHFPSWEYYIIILVLIVILYFKY